MMLSNDVNKREKGCWEIVMLTKQEEKKWEIIMSNNDIIASNSFYKTA